MRFIGARTQASCVIIHGEAGSTRSSMKASLLPAPRIFKSRMGGRTFSYQAPWSLSRYTRLNLSLHLNLIIHAHGLNRMSITLVILLEVKGDGAQNHGMFLCPLSSLCISVFRYQWLHKCPLTSDPTVLLSFTYHHNLFICVCCMCIPLLPLSFFYLFSPSLLPSQLSSGAPPPFFGLQTQKRKFIWKLSISLCRNLLRF